MDILLTLNWNGYIGNVLKSSFLRDWYIHYCDFPLNSFNKRPVQMTDTIYAMDGCNLFPSAVRSLSRRPSLYLPCLVHLFQRQPLLAWSFQIALALMYNIFWNSVAREAIWNGRPAVIRGRYVVVTSATLRPWFSSPIPMIPPLLLPSSEWINHQCQCLNSI